MKLSPYVRDYDNHLEDVSKILSDTSTHIVLDTSILVWMLTAEKTAYDEMIGWLAERPERSVHVAAWSAHEFHHHLAKKTAKENVSSVIKSTVTTYEEFAKLVCHRADEATCRSYGFGTREHFIGLVEEALSKLRVFSKVVEFKDQDTFERTEVVIAFINERVLKTDLTPIVDRTSANSEFRMAHRMPPAFKDRTKPENKMGDLIIWEEILQFVDQATTTTNVIFVSSDEKTDWISKAVFVQEDNGKTQQPSPQRILDVRHPHPMLVHELETREHAGEFYILNPKFLAGVIEYSEKTNAKPVSVGKWLMATDRPSKLKSFATRQAANRAEASERSGLITRPVPASVEVSPEGSSQLGPELTAFDFQRFKTSRISMNLDDFEAMSASEAAEWADRAVENALSGELGFIQLGKLWGFYASNSSAAFTQLPTLVETLKAEASRPEFDKFLLSLLLSGYFDAFGHPVVHPITRLASYGVSLESSPDLGEVLNQFSTLLRSAEVMLPRFPLQNVSKQMIDLEIVPTGSSADQELRELRINGEQVLYVGGDRNTPMNIFNLMQADDTQTTLSGLELRRLLEQNYFFPTDKLPKKWDSRTLVLEPNHALLRIDTTTETGFEVRTS